MARKLKVFQAQFGFYDTVVATPSQAAALRAWGSHQNLFQDGQARVASDEKAIAAALAQPGIPLRRAVGSDDPFSLEPRLPELPDLPEQKPESKKTGTTVPTRARSAALRKATPKPQPPDRSALDAAATALKSLTSARASEEKSFRKRHDALVAEEAAAASRYAAARTQAETALNREQRIFDKAKRDCEGSR